MTSSGLRLGSPPRRANPPRERLNVRAATYAESRRGIAAGLLAVNKANSEEFFAGPRRKPRSTMRRPKTPWAETNSSSTSRLTTSPNGRHARTVDS